MLPFDLIKGYTEGLRQLLQELEPFTGRQLRTEFLRLLFGLLRIVFEVESSKPAGQLNQPRAGSPKQV